MDLLKRMYCIVVLKSFVDEKNHLILIIYVQIQVLYIFVAQYITCDILQYIVFPVCSTVSINKVQPTALITKGVVFFISVYLCSLLLWN